VIINIPDNWLPTSENINALPRPVRDYIMRLHANTDPAGEISRAMVAEMERDALRKMIEEAPQGVVVEAGGSLSAVVVGRLPPGSMPAGKRVKLIEVE
jgi:hypothetical protein